MSIAARARRLCFVKVSALAVCVMAASSCRPSGSNATAADAPAAATSRVRGLDLAGIDRSVPPGDDFFSLRQRHLAQATTEIPPDRSTYGPTAIVAERTRPSAPRAASRTAAKATPPAGTIEQQGRRLLRELHGRGGHRGQGPGAAAADARPHRRHRLARARCRALLGEDAARRRGRAQRHQLLHRSTCSACGSRRTWTIPRATGPICCRAASTCPTATYYLDASPRMAELRTEFAAHVARTLRLASRGGSPTPRRRARRRARDQDRARRTPAGAESVDVHEGNNPWKREEFPQERARARLGGVPGRRAGLDTAAGDRRLASRGRARALGARRAASRSTSWKDYLDLPRHRPQRRGAARGVRRGALRLPRHGAAAARRSGATAGSGALRRDQRRARRGRRPDLRRDATSRPRTKAQMQAMVKNLIAAFGRRIDRLDWMSPATKAKAQAEAGDAAASASAIRTRGVDYPRPRDRARRRLRQRAARRALRVPSGTSPSSASRWTAASG